MKITTLCALCTFLGSLAFAQETKKKNTAPPASAPQKQQQQKQPPRGTSGLPLGAERTAEGTYRWKDKDGKVWIFRETPFGYMRSSEAAAEENTKVTQSEKLIVVAGVEGDTIRFERPNAFGVSRWTRKKAELNTEEQQALDRFENRSSEGAANSRKQESQN